jgi:hypothetical protein
MYYVTKLKLLRKEAWYLLFYIIMTVTITSNPDLITTTCGKQFNLSDAELVIERSNSLFSYNIHKLRSGDYIIAEKFYANPFNNRYILLNDEQIEMLKNL